MKDKNTNKPESQEEQISVIWDFLFNHLAHRVKFIDLKIAFILGFLTLILALLGVLIVKG